MHYSISHEHAQHDLDLIAAHAAGDLTDSERPAAEALIASCTSCAVLRDDLVAIAAATRVLPTPAVAGRDFRLTEAQAARLRRGSLKSLRRPFATRRWAVRPMATAFTSLGLAGLLVAEVLPALFGGSAASAPQAGAGGGLAAPAATAAAAPAASARADVPVAAGSGATDSRNSAEFGAARQPTLVATIGGSKGYGPTTAPEVALGGGNAIPTNQRDAADRLAAQDSDRIVAETNPMLIGSLVLLGVGLALFGLRFVGRRVH